LAPLQAPRNLRRGCEVWQSSNAWIASWHYDMVVREERADRGDGNVPSGGDGALARDASRIGTRKPRGGDGIGSPRGGPA